MPAGLSTISKLSSSKTTFKFGGNVEKRPPLPPVSLLLPARTDTTSPGYNSRLYWLWGSLLTANYDKIIFNKQYLRNK